MQRSRKARGRLHRRCMRLTVPSRTHAPTRMCTEQRVRRQCGPCLHVAWRMASHALSAHARSALHCDLGAAVQAESSQCRAALSHVVQSIECFAHRRVLKARSVRMRQRGSGACFTRMRGRGCCRIKYIPVCECATTAVPRRDASAARAQGLPAARSGGGCCSSVVCSRRRRDRRPMQCGRHHHFRRRPPPRLSCC